MPLIYLDSCILISLVEGLPETRAKIMQAIQPTDAPAPMLAVSDLTRLECRVVPLREGNGELLAMYDDFFAAEEVLKVLLTPAVFDLATELRARKGLRTPDALHVAAATASRCDSFLTSDLRIAKHTLPVPVQILT